MKNLKVATKLLVGFMIVTMLAVVLAGVGIYSSMSINGNYTYLLDNPVTRERNVHAMQLQFTLLRYNATKYATEIGNVDTINQTLIPQFDTAFATLNENLEAFRASNQNDARRADDAKELNEANAAALGAKLDEFKIEMDKVRESALAGNETATMETLRAAVAISNEVNTMLEGLINPAIELVAAESLAMDQTALNLTIVLIAITVVCAIASIWIAMFISRLISKPLVALAGFMGKAGGTGDITLRQEDKETIGKFGSAKDEIGQVINNTAAFLAHVNRISDNLTIIASGDLTPEIELLSNDDTMGTALKIMTENLNMTFSEFNSASSHVMVGSNQVAAGAQSLAQGATEQAASIQELSSAMAEIADNTKASAKLAERSADLASSIKGSAEKGSQQMSDMVAAVGEINEASHSIGQVIKTIDDIAFQTNILALNAAVEAARAGEHGKGFAVVAGEVRNLAAKSAEAAKETESLIANSISKAELGGRIAAETADSLSEIVSGINESEKMVREIAGSSAQQSAGISEINIGIDQVAQVVQQNSATAEESAAASEEMSGQSVLLRDMISRFRLKDNNEMRALPEASGHAQHVAHLDNKYIA